MEKKSLKDEFPSIAEEWDYNLTETPKGWNVKKRGDFCPENITRGSEYVVNWLCPFKHSYKATIVSRTHMGSGCPICSRKKKTSKYEYIIEYYLLKYFSREDIIHSYKSDWLGKLEIDVFIKSLNIGFEYDGEYYHRDGKIRDEKKNILCAENNVVLFNFRYKELPILNTPKAKTIGNFNIIKYDDDTKIYNIILQKKDSVIEFERALKIIFESIGLNEIEINVDRHNIDIFNLMYISNVKNSLEVINPDLCREWNYKKNKKLLPKMFTANSGEKVWWICRNGHEWEAVIGSRNHGRKCPFCTNRDLQVGFNDLQTVFPEIAREWDYEKNINMPNAYLAGSVEKVWWKCDKGHSYQAKICNRTTKIHNTDCPYCSNRKVLYGYNDLASQFPEIAKEWHYEKNVGLSPKEITKRSGKKVWWKCGSSSIFEHSYLMSVDQRIRGNSCPYCCCPPKKLMKGLNDLKSRNPELMKEWDFDKNDIDPGEIFMGGGKNSAWFICNRGHRYKTLISDKVNGGGCPFCSGRRVLKGFNDFETKCYENGKGYLLKEWSLENLIKPDEIAYKSNISVEWICPQNHKYKSMISNRVAGRNCPYCSHKKLLQGFNDLKTLYPDIIERWNYDKNTNNKELNKLNKWNCNMKGEFIPENILGSGRNLYAYFKGSDTPKFIHNIIKNFKK